MPLAARLSVILKGAPECVGQCLHPFIARMTSHASVLNLAFCTCKIGGVRAKLADVNEDAPRILTGLFHELIFLSILPKLAADKKSRLSALR